MKVSWESFLCGSIVTSSVLCLIRDLMGKEQYIEYVNNNWIDIPWPFWIPVIALTLAGQFIFVKEDNDAQK